MNRILHFIAYVWAARGADPKDERGATATEYALLVALIAIVIAVAVGLFGTNLSTFFNNIASTVSSWT